MFWFSWPLGRGVRMGTRVGGRGGDGTGAILFAMFMLIVAVLALWVVITALTIWSVVTGLIKLTERKYVQAILCFCLGGFLIYTEYQVDFYGLRGCYENGCPGWTYVAKDNHWTKFPD